MIGRPKPKKLTQEQEDAFTSASMHQTGGMSTPKTYDPNYPLFDVPVGKKVLVYVPNHTITLEDGSSVIRADRFASHDAKKGRAFISLRCSSGVIHDGYGWDGSCPLCEGNTDCWALANAQWDEFCKARGIDPESQSSKDTYSKEYKGFIEEMAIQSSDTWITFPIVVIDTDDRTPTKPRLNEQNQVVGTPMFYTIRARSYDDKWGAAFDMLMDKDPTAVEKNPAGRWVLLSFVYTPKSGQPNKRDAAKALTVSILEKEGLESWEKYFDDMTKEWTPACAREVLVRNVVRDMDEQTAAAEELMASTREKLHLLQLKKSGGVQAPAVASNADAALASFGAQPAGAPTGGQPPAQPTGMGEMPTGVGVGVE